MQLRTRFAPSPTGLLHVGNAFSALCCQQWARQNDAELLLRIEDIDHTRCRPKFINSIFEDLSWLGLSWPEPVRQQSRQLDDYRAAIHRLRELGVVYPCFCTRKSIQQEMERMALAPHAEDFAGLYPGICRDLSSGEQAERMERYPFAWRLDIAKALARLNRPLSWQEADGTIHTASLDHDEVIGRKDIAFSYHLAVVVDDAIQEISHIIRGEDLKACTAIHRLLQELLELPEPTYIHHRLLKTTAGERLAKRNSATTVASLRTMGIDPVRLADFLLTESEPIWPFAETDAAIDKATIERLLGNS